MPKLKIPFTINQKGGVVNNILSVLKTYSNEISEKKEKTKTKENELKLIKASETKNLFKKKKIKIKTRTKVIKKR